MKTDTRSNQTVSRLRTNARIIWAIARKDILEALKNKNTLAVLLTAIPMVFVYYYLPILSARGEAPHVYVYDAGDSVLVARLENSDMLDVRTYASEARMLEALRNSDTPELGLAIPVGFDQALEAGAETYLEGYVLDWVRADEAQHALQLVEDEIAYQLGRSVPVSLQNPVFLDQESHGMGTSVGIAWVFVVTMIGLTLVPHLILEEKQSRTMDVMMVSPASSGSFVVGKAVAGLFYSLVAAAVAMVVYRAVVVHWWLAVITTVIGALFAISLGLLLGSIIESRAQMTMWAWVFILPMFLPVFLSLLEGLVPDRVVEVMRLLPMVVVMNLLRASCAGAVPLGPVLLKLGWLTTLVAGGMVSVGWVLRRQDRESGKSSIQGQEPRTTPVLGALGDRLQSAAVRFSKRREPLKAEPAFKDPSLARRRDLAGRKRSSWSILWAVATKDIRATIKNKLALSIMLGSAFIVASNALPRFLLQSRDVPGVVVFDQGRSTIVRALDASEEVRIGVVDSEQEMQETVSESQDTLIGLVIPPDFDRMAGSSEVIELEAYIVHWAEEDRVERFVTLIEDQLSSGTWGDVRVRVSDQKIYPSADLRGQTLMFVLLFVVVILTMGLALAPLLIVDERQAHTFEVLLVSPARITEVIGGKALAGAFYCLLAALVIFILNHVLVVHWGVALLAVLLGATFSVSVGLLVGLASDNPTTVSLWGALLLLVFTGLTFLRALPGIDWPTVFGTLLKYVPTAALARMMGIALAGELLPVQVWANAAALLVAVAVAVALLGWRLRFIDR